MHATDLDYSMHEVLENSTYEIENGQIKDKTLKTPIKNLEGFNGKIVYDENWNEICIGGITSLKIPGNVTSIGNSAFSYNNLESVTFVGRNNLDGVTLGDYVWGWAEGYSDANIGFSN